MSLAKQSSNYTENIKLLEVLRRENVYLCDIHFDTWKLIGDSSQMQNLSFMINFFSHRDIPHLLITGETGTRRELIAKTIHIKSFRDPQEFTYVACSSSQSMRKPELSGFEKAVFLGSIEAKQNKPALYPRGTIFLDEVSEIDLETQEKLLKFLEQKKGKRNGGQNQKPSDVMIIAATSKELSDVVAAGTFLRDLYFHLNSFKIEVPPLRFRKTDIPLIVEFYLEKLSKQMGMKRKNISQGALDLLMTYNWPGNVCELINVLERAMLLGKGDTLSHHDFSKLKRGKRDFITIKKMEKQHILAALKETNGNKKEAASLLGIGRATLYAKLKD